MRHHDQIRFTLILCHFYSSCSCVLEPFLTVKYFNNYAEKCIRKDHYCVWWGWEDSKSSSHYHVWKRLRESLHAVRGWVYQKCVTLLFVEGKISFFRSLFHCIYTPIIKYWLILSASGLDSQIIVQKKFNFNCYFLFFKLWNVKNFLIFIYLFFTKIVPKTKLKRNSKHEEDVAAT